MLKDVIVVVSGLPRSGTSLMMQMLEAGGIVVVTDGIRERDESNPKGYYEFEKVKQLSSDSSWLADCRGKAVKIISQLLSFLPGEHRYKVIFMLRQMDEILKSQKAMLIRRGKDSDDNQDAELEQIFAKHLEKVHAWLASQHHIDVLTIKYNDIITDMNLQVENINQFLEGQLDTSAMLKVFDPSLYRQKADVSS